MPQSVNLDLFNKLSEQAAGCPRHVYWYFFCSPDVPRIFSEHLDSTWHALHGDSDDWVKQTFCVGDGMKDFLLEDRKVLLKPYAQDAKLKEQWMQDFKDPRDWEVAPAWYDASS